MKKREEQYDLAERMLNMYIVAHNLRRTPERYMILEEICCLPKVFTVGELQQRMEGKYISRGTLYNTIQLFEKARLIWKKGNRGLRAEYEFAAPSPHRVEVHCLKCGRVSTFKDPTVENMIMWRKYSNFNITHFALTVYGVCKDCNKNKRVKRI